LHGAVTANNKIKLTAWPQYQARTLVTRPSLVQTTFKNQRLRPNFNKVPIPAQITDRYIREKTGTQQNGGGDRGGRLMAPMTEHPHQ
jgi:hypothetical protein